MGTFAAVVICALFLQPSPLSAQQEIVAAIQVHGNTLTPTEEVVRASGVAVGDRVSETTLSEAEARLRRAIKSDSVDVLKRFASISDPTQVLILIQLDEGPVRVDIPDIGIRDVDAEAPKLPLPRTPRPPVVRRARFNMMFVPIIGAEDGYGLTYGAQFAFMGHRNARRRVVIPASWGGDKRIGVEFQQEFQRRFVPRLRTGAMLQRRRHPFYALRQKSSLDSARDDPELVEGSVGPESDSTGDDNADRTRVWGRTDWPIVRDVRAGAEVAWQSSALAGEETEARSVGADVVIDTRVDPLMPHNAVFLRSAVERLHFSTSTSAVRTEIDANGYVGVYRGTVLALRAVREDFSRPAPPFYKSLLGGSRNLRGFRAGRAVGDTLVAGSVELRIPTTSPLRMARFGYSVFIDAGTTYDKGQRFRDQKLERGVGAGIWMTAPLFRFSAAVARGLGSGIRAHIGAGLTF